MPTETAKSLLAEGFSLSDQSHADTGFQRNVQYFLIAGILFILFHKKRTGNYFVFISRYTGQ